MLELLFRGFFEWIYRLILECWEYFSSVLFDLMSLDFAYLETYMPIITTIRQIMLGVGWALLLGNLVFQATRSMVAGIGFEADDPKLLFTRTFVFSFLLVASPQICDICLNMTSVIIDMVQMPDAAAIKLPDEGFFVDLTASWLLVIVFGLIVMFQTCKLFFEMAERYFILAVLTITAPLAFGVGGSRSTSDIFSGWCRMYGSMCLLMVMNVVFVKMLLSILSFRPSGIAVLPWIVMVLTVVKVAKKSDAIITRIGLNPAITGDSLGRSFPGVLTYTVARTMASRVVQTAGKNTAAGKTGAQTQTKSGSKPGSKPASGGRYYGGVNTVNTFADSRRSEQQSGSSPRQAEPRASGAEPTAQPASAAADRSFVMPGTRRPVSHVPGEQKIAPSDTAGKAGHTVSRSSHVQAGAQQHTASAAQQHTATSAFESRYSRNTGPARSTVAGKIARPAPASANAPTEAPRSSTIPQERSAAPAAVSTGQRSWGRPDTAGMSHSTRRPTVSPTKNKLFCAECGSPMGAGKGCARHGAHSPSRLFYDCNRYRYSAHTACSSHYIRHERLLAAVTDALDQQLTLAVDVERLIHEIDHSAELTQAKQEKQNTATSLRLQRQSLDRKLDMLIHDLSTGLIGREEFLYAKEKYRAELNRILAAEAAQKERIEQMQKGLSTAQAWVRAMQEYRRLPAITRELLDTLVERISIHEDRSITIQLNYADPFAALRSYHTLTEETAYCG